MNLWNRICITCILIIFIIACYNIHYLIIDNQKTIVDKQYIELIKK